MSNYSMNRAEAAVMASTRHRLALDEMAQLRAIAEFPGEVIIAASELRSMLDMLQNRVALPHATALSPDEEAALLASARFAANQVKQRFAEVFGVPMVPKVKGPDEPNNLTEWDLY